MMYAIVTSDANGFFSVKNAIVMRGFLRIVINKEGVDKFFGRFTVTYTKANWDLYYLRS